jgi:L-ascorbate metabolism protein UlaG (beta-lactamase superfamily)
VHPLAELQISPGSVGIHWFEQNAYALRSAQGTIVLIDPFFPHHRPPERFIRPGPPVRESELPTDYVLLTHDHMDHTNPETIARIHAAWPEAQYVGPEDAVARVLSQTKVDKAHTTAIAAPGRRCRSRHSSGERHPPGLCDRVGGTQSLCHRRPDQQL